MGITTATKGWRYARTGAAATMPHLAEPLRGHSLWRSKGYYNVVGVDKQATSQLVEVFRVSRPGTLAPVLSVLYPPALLEMLPADRAIPA
ncbi:hypothetical protein D3C81_1955790 [compost metagenome]